MVLAALLATLCASSSLARNPPIQEQFFLVQASNNSGNPADGFRVDIQGADSSGWDAGSVFCSDSTATATFFDDGSGVSIVWSNVYTPPGNTSSFGFGLYPPGSITACDAYWTSQGAALTHLDDLWPDWTTLNGSVQNVINNRTGGERWVRVLPEADYVTRSMGYLGKVGGMTIDWLQTYLAQEIGPGSTLPFDYAQNLNDSMSLFMTYDVYPDSASAASYAPSIRFSTSVNLETPSSETLTFTNLGDVCDKFWYPNQGSTDVPILGVNIAASTSEAVTLQSLTIYPWDNTNGADVSSVKVWLDSAGSGVINSAANPISLPCPYPAQHSQTVIQLTPQQVIPAGGNLKLLISVSLNSNSQPGDEIGFSLGNASGVGNTSGEQASCSGLSMETQRVVIGTIPITISAAKKMGVDSTGQTFVTLANEVITADLQSTMGMAYLQEQNRSAGIGCLIPANSSGNQQSIPVVSYVTVVGSLKLSTDGAELVLNVIDGVSTSGQSARPLAMSNKSTGGGAFGGQPALTDNAALGKQSTGPSNVGLLVRTWGRVTGLGQLTIDGAQRDVCWIDDGSGLQDGLMGFSGIAVVKPTDWQGNNPVVGQTMVATGILRAIANKPSNGQPVRLLVPRSQTQDVILLGSGSAGS